MPAPDDACLAFTPPDRRPTDRLVQALARFLLQEAARFHPAPQGPPAHWWRGLRLGRRAIRRLLVGVLRLEANGLLEWM
jgi:hypothetical protein